MRMRKYCMTCFKEQKRLWRESIKELKITQPVSTEPATIDYSTNPDYIFCEKCSQYKHTDDWYMHKRGNSKKLYRSTFCKVCSASKYKEDYYKKKGGRSSEFVYSKPNIYADELQKELTFEVLTLLGYIYNEEIGIWLKPGIKELNVNGKLFFPKVKKRKRKNETLTHKDCELIHKYYKEGYNVHQVAKLVKRHPSTVWKRLSTYEPTFKKTYKTS